MENGFDSSKNEKEQLFSSLISSIKSYSGNDPLLPWLQGIKKLKESIPPNLLSQKLPRFLQKCAITFEADRRYRNDLRYIRVWIQLMDYVDDPKVLLKTMERNKIGTKHAIFYQAYALYYEKFKKLEEAFKMYHLGVKNLAEPVEELEKSYEKFLVRVYKRRKTRRQEVRAAMAAKGDEVCHKDMNVNKDKEREETNNQFPADNYRTMNGMEENLCNFRHAPKRSSNCLRVANENSDSKICAPIQQHKNLTTELEKTNSFCGDDTVVVKFVGPAIVGKSEAEDPCHHGLVDPTVNMKEAMNAINNMFREPLELELKGMRSKRNQPKTNQPASKAFEVFTDENCELPANESGAESGFFHVGHTEHPLVTKSTLVKNHATSLTKNLPPQESFQIYVDDDEKVNGSKKDSETQCYAKNSILYVCPPNISNDNTVKSSPPVKHKEDTVVCRFVGSTIFAETEVENACHHGLVDPTINLREALHDINGMFGKPLDFIKTNKPKKDGNFVNRKRENNVFSIYTDENSESQEIHSSARSVDDSSLNEPTLFTKEAMDDINAMFGMPMDL